MAGLLAAVVLGLAGCTSAATGAPDTGQASSAGTVAAPLTGSEPSAATALAEPAPSEPPRSETSPLTTGSTPPPASPPPSPLATDATAPALPTGADPPPPCPGVRCLTVVMTGDVLLHEPLWAQAEADGGPGAAMDFAPLLAGQRPYVEPADVAICHLETPLAPTDGPYQGYPNFVVPPQILGALVETGYDACTTASNHSNDDGTEGINRTLDTLDAAGLAHAGTARTPEEDAAPTLVTTRGGVVGIVSGTYDLNGNDPEQQWQVDLIDPSAILADAAAARAAGADVVVVALHAGLEYQSEPTGQQQELARTLLADPAVDLVYGHHAHVVQPLERIDGKWVVYGLGNTVAAHGIEDLGNREGLLVRVQFAQQDDGFWTTGDVAWVPSLVHNASPYRWCSLLADQVCSTPDADRESLDRITTVVNSLGADTAGAHRLSF